MAQRDSEDDLAHSEGTNDSATDSASDAPSDHATEPAPAAVESATGDDPDEVDAASGPSAERAGAHEAAEPDDDAAEPDATEPEPDAKPSNDDAPADGASVAASAEETGERTASDETPSAAEAARDDDAASAAIETDEDPAEAPAETSRDGDRTPADTSSNGLSPDMRAFARRTMRSWGVYSGGYGALLVLCVVFLLPGKSVAWSGALIAWAIGWLAAGHGLFRERRWGWRAGVVVGFVGLAMMVVVVSGLVGSWSYLRGVYGDFGRGASIGALMFASVGLQALGLVPGLLLRAMLRREVRRYVGTDGRGWIKATIGLAFLPFIVGSAVHVRYAMDAEEVLTEDGRALSVAYLRARVRGEAPPSLGPLEGVPVGEGPLYVTIWDRGAALARITGDGEDLAEALEAAGDALVEAPAVASGNALGGRIKIDRIAGVAPVLSENASVVGISVNPGRDGLRRGDRAVLPDDLVKRQGFGVVPLVPGIREIRLGLDAAPVLRRLDQGTGDLERIRTESWIETPSLDGALAVERGNTPAHQLGPEGWRAAAIAGGDFVLRQIQPDGRFHYQYFPTTDTHAPPGGEYSIPRHAGTVYSLALLFGETGEERFRTGAERAIEWLDGRIPHKCGIEARGCVVSGGQASLGSTALALVGMLEYQRTTGDTRYEPNIRRLLEFVLFMQMESGDFWHTYIPREDFVDESVRSMFYSEESALALVMAHEILGDERYIVAGERALDFLTDEKYDPFFLGKFVYGADHWTCIAAEEVYPTLDKPAYLDFCRGYASFMRRIQYEPDDWPPGFRGHYGFGAIMVPQAPAAAGFTEAIISTWLLAEHHGEPADELETQMSEALDALTRDQIRADNAWLMPNPEAAHGGIRRSLVEHEVRIDFTQHALSALIRGAHPYLSDE